jgi:hypothetical protein
LRFGHGVIIGVRFTDAIAHDLCDVGDVTLGGIGVGCGRDDRDHDQINGCLHDLMDGGTGGAAVGNLESGTPVARPTPRALGRVAAAL